MADGRDDLATVVELRRQLDVYRVDREVYNRTMPTDIENRIVVRSLDVSEPQAVLELGLDGGILEESLAFIVLEHLNAASVDGREGPLRRREGDLGMWCEDVVRVGGFGEIPTLRMHSKFHTSEEVTNFEGRAYSVGTREGLVARGENKEDSGLGHGRFVFVIAACMRCLNEVEAVESGYLYAAQTARPHVLRHSSVLKSAFLAIDY